MLDRIERTCDLRPLSAEQHSRLLEIANKCPVHRTLTRKSTFEPNSCDPGLAPGLLNRRKLAESRKDSK